MRRARVLVAAVGLAVALPLAGGPSAPPASACEPYGCDPPPHGIDQPVWLEWGCGTVAVHVLKWETKPLPILPCPGPVLW